MTTIKAPFLFEGNINKALLALFVAINLLVLTNTVLHDPVIGYDGTEHLKYLRVLPYRLPVPAETREYFSAPLPYFLPSLLDKACLRWRGEELRMGVVDNCVLLAGKFAQLVNFILSVVTTYWMVAIAGIVRPNSRFVKISTLALLGVMTVFYKTFSQVRGEPYLLCFTVWVIYLIAKVLSSNEQITWRSGVLPGVGLGLVLLSRQWGFMLVVALSGLWVLAWMSGRGTRWQLAASLGAGAITTLLVCGWFYLSLYWMHGTFLPFNRLPLGFSFSNQPSTFYRNTGLKNLLLFKSPVRGSFNNQFIPMFYSDVWGDYWGHFVFIQERSQQGEQGYGNIEQVAPYLGRVNAVAILPSLIFFAGLLVGATSLLRVTKGGFADLFYGFLFLYTLVSFALYLYFILIYPIPGQGDTIKAVYMMHALVVLPILGAEFLERVRVRSSLAYSVCMALLALVALHNLPAMITRYRMFYL